MLCGSVPLHAQAKKAKEPSHAERFADPKFRIERSLRQAESQLQKNPNDVQALADRAEARLRLGRLEEALRDFRQAAALEPRSAEAQANFAYALWRLRRWPEALAAARAALALNPDHFSAHYYTGMMLLQTDQDTEQAIRHLQRAIELNPEQTEIRFELFNAYRRQRDAIRAGLQLRILRGLLPPSDARPLYAEGLLAADLDHMSTAIERFRQALDAEPRFSPARQDLGMALIQTERWEEATHVLEVLASEQPQSFSAAYFHALALQNTQKPEKAEQEARRAVNLNPTSADAQAMLGIMHSGKGAHSEAIGWLESAVQIDPKNYDGWFYLGRVRYALHNNAGARDALRMALQLRPAEIEPRFFLGTVLEALGEKDAAVAEYKAIIVERPDDVRGHLGLGNIYSKYGQLEEAIAALERARQLDPQNFEAALALGRALARSGQWQSAIPLLREAVARGPESAEAHYQLGLALRRTGSAQEAAEQFAIVERLNQAFRTQGSGMEPPRSENARPPQS